MKDERLEGLIEESAREVGYWRRPESVKGRKHSYVWECSVCGDTCHCIGGSMRGAENRCGYRYCPNCGVRMNKEKGNDR